MNDVKGSIAIQYTPQGDTLNVSLRATQPLVQYLKKGTAAVSPDWGVAQNQPTVYPVVRSSLTDSRVSPLDGSERWQYNGADILFDTKGASLALGSLPAGVFVKTRAAVDGDVPVPCLTIAGNLVTLGANNAQLSFAAKVNTGMVASIAADKDIRLEEIEGDPYQGFIRVNDGGVIDDDTSALTLTAELTRGGVPSRETVAYRWSRIEGNDYVDTGARTQSITLTADDIDNQEQYRVEFVIDGTVVATYVQAVYDERDPLAMLYNPSSDTNISVANPQCTIRPTIVRQGDASMTPIAGYTYLFMLTDAGGKKLPDSDGEGDSYTVTLSHVRAALGGVYLWITGRLARR
jgi:hypothetical protein